MRIYFFTAPFYFAFIGFRVQGFRVQGSGFKVQGSGGGFAAFLEDSILVSQPFPLGQCY